MEEEQGCEPSLVIIMEKLSEDGDVMHPLCMTDHPCRETLEGVRRR